MAADAVFSPSARRDLAAAVEWIARDNRTAARGLRAAVTDAAARIGEHPETGVVRADLAEEPVRFLILTGYPYVMVYDAARRPPLVLRVLHGARDLPTALKPARGGA